MYLFRNVLGTRTLGEILADREKIASEMQVSINDDDLLSVYAPANIN